MIDTASGEVEDRDLSANHSAVRCCVTSKNSEIFEAAIAGGTRLAEIAYQTVLERGICNAAAARQSTGYDFNRMVLDFTMFNQGKTLRCPIKTVRCAISTAAMDDLESKHEVKADQRVDQFLRLRDATGEWGCDPMC
jgi:hypothetical protein